jgi:hypothetical protein
VWLRFALAIAALTSLVGCSPTTASPSDDDLPTAAPSGASAPASQAPIQTLTLTFDKPAVVGTEVRVAASGMPAGKDVELTWSTVAGGWVIEDYYHFRGKKYEDTSLTLGRFPVDANGYLNARFTIPEDYGGVHDVVALVDGRPLAQNGVEVTQSFELSPTSGPVGTPIELKVKGLGWRTMESTWVVNWDNNLLGFVSAASSKGSAVARFRAAGPAGAHIVQVLTGYQGQGYLNHEQAPTSYLPRPQFTFHTTPGVSPRPAAYAEPYPRQPVPDARVHVAGATVGLTPTQGPVGTRAMLRGQGLAAGTQLQLVWQTFVGNRVSGDGYGPSERPLGTVTVDRDGRLDSPIAIPDDLGGVHGIEIRDGDRMLAQLSFAIETSIVGISPASGPVGTPVTIHLKGVGWTEYDNIYVATYDNAYMGYACGFNSAGDVVINFTASGAPGEHIIDLYPGIYQGPATEPQLLYRQAQLTYADDHPGNKIPALRFTFRVTSYGTSHERRP